MKMNRIIVAFIFVACVFSLTFSKPVDVLLEPAEIGKPVKWIKRFKMRNTENITKELNISFNLPIEAENISIKDRILNKRINNVFVRVNRTKKSFFNLKRDKKSLKELRRSFKQQRKC